jgi:hypothetical protein
MSKNLKVTLVLILVGCGGANSIDAVSLSSTSITDLQILSNSVTAMVSVLSFVVY